MECRIPGCSFTKKGSQVRTAALLEKPEIQITVPPCLQFVTQGQPRSQNIKNPINNPEVLSGAPFRVPDETSCRSALSSCDTPHESEARQPPGASGGQGSYPGAHVQVTLFHLIKAPQQRSGDAGNSNTGEQPESAPVKGKGEHSAIRVMETVKEETSALDCCYQCCEYPTLL